MKGGVGKTTLALNIAIALSMSEQMAHAHPGDARVCLIDADRQHTAMAFTEIRRRRVAREMGYKSPLNAPCGPGYCAMDLQGPTIRTQVPQVERVNPYVVIDVGGRDSGSLRAALTISNLVLVPTAPRSFDLWSVDQTANLIREAREINADLRAVAVLNGADPAGRDNEEAIAALTDMGLEVAPCRIGRRKAFPDAAAEGFGVLEYRGSSAVKARQEFMQLFTFLFPEKELSL
jgi:chromosome partitioning protein